MNINNLTLWHKRANPLPSGWEEYCQTDIAGLMTMNLIPQTRVLEPGWLLEYRFMHNDVEHFAPVRVNISGVDWFEAGKYRGDHHSNLVISFDYPSTQKGDFFVIIATLINPEGHSISTTRGNIKF